MIKLLIKIIQIIFIVILSILLILIISGVLLFAFNKLKNSYIYKQVTSISLEEFARINLDNELREERDTRPSGLGCSYDYKVRALRCHTSNSMYFVTSTPMVEEFQRIDTYLKSLGWDYSYGEGENMEDLQKTVSKGLAPYEIYRKKNKYDLDLYLTFYRQKEEECKYICNDKIKSILERYKTPENSVYAITVSTDIID